MNINNSYINELKETCRSILRQSAISAGDLIFLFPADIADLPAGWQVFAD